MARDRLAVHELHGEERNAVLLPDVEEGHDARVGQRPRDARLLVEALDEGLVLGALAGDVEADRLDRQRALDEGVEGPVDGPHRAEAEGPRDLVAADRGRDLAGGLLLSSLIDPPGARSLPTLPRCPTTLARFDGPSNARSAQVTTRERVAAVLFSSDSMPGTAAEVVAYDALHQPLSPLFLDYLAGRGGGLALPRPGRLRPRRDRRRRRAVGRLSSGRWRPWPGRSRASRRRAGRRGRRSARGPSPSRERRRSSPASRPASSAGRSSSCGRPWPRSGWRGSSRRSAGAPSCPSSGWPRTTTTSRRSARRASSTRAGRIRTLRYAPRHEPVGQPAWAIPLDDTITGARRGARPGPPAGPGPRRGSRGRGGVLPARRDALGGVRAPRVPPAARAGRARPERTRS